MSSPARVTLLQVVGPLTVKEVEDRVFHAARSDEHFEAAQRTWLEEDRSFFVRWRRSAGSQLRVVGLVHAYQLPEMASRVEVIAFDEDDEPGTAGLQRYAELLRAELEPEGFM